MFSIKNKIQEWLRVPPQPEWHKSQWAIAMGMSVGNNVNFVPPTNFGSEPYLISIGDDTTISFDVAFVTHDAATRVIRNMLGKKSKDMFFCPNKSGKKLFCWLSNHHFSRSNHWR